MKRKRKRPASLAAASGYAVLSVRRARGQKRKVKVGESYDLNVTLRLLRQPTRPEFLAAKWKARADMLEKELGAAIANGSRWAIKAECWTLRRCARELTP